MPVDKTVVKKEKGEWVIKRHEGFIKLEKLAKKEEDAPEITIVPGIGKEDGIKVLPVEVRIKEESADIKEVIDEAVPAVINKEHQCKVCKKAAERIKKKTVKKELKDEILDAIIKSRPGILEMMRKLV